MNHSSSLLCASSEGLPTMPGGPHLPVLFLQFWEQLLESSFWTVEGDWKVFGTAAKTPGYLNSISECLFAVLPPLPLPASSFLLMRTLGGCWDAAQFSGLCPSSRKNKWVEFQVSGSTLAQARLL